jgi:hypothetical protein
MGRSEGMIDIDELEKRLAEHDSQGRYGVIPLDFDDLVTLLRELRALRAQLDAWETAVDDYNSLRCNGEFDADWIIARQCALATAEAKDVAAGGR